MIHPFIHLVNPERARASYWFAAALLCLIAPALGLAQAPPSFTISTVVGTCTASGGVPPCSPGYSGDGGSATSATLSGPAAVTFDSSGNLYIADTCNQRVREVSTGGSISTFAGDGTVTAGCIGTYSGAGGAPTSAGFNSPSGLTFDSKGNLYIADSDNYVVWEVTGGTISVVAGHNGLGASFSGDLGPATSAGLWNPSGVAVDSSGNIYIADPFNNVVRVVCETQTPIPCTNGDFVGPNGYVIWAAGDITTFAGQNATGLGYNGDGGQSTGALLNNPNGVLVDGTGDVLIADTNNCAIRKVTPDGIITTVAGDGSGQPGYSGDGGEATKAQLSNPKGIALDANGNLYIADTGNSVIRMVLPNGLIYTIAGNNSPGYAGDGGAGTSAQLYFPSGVAVNGGKVYVADNGNNVIRLLTPVTQVPKINTGGVVSDASYTAPVAPGSIAAVFGDFFLTLSSTSPTVPLSTTLQTLSFDFGSTAAPLYFVSGGQVNLQVPWEVTPGSAVSLTPTLNGTGGASQNVNVAAFAPAIFTTNAQGTGAGAILDSTYKLVDASNPAVAGTTVLLIYCTGLGDVLNRPATGAAAPVSGPTSDTTSPTTVTIGGVTESAMFSGLAPGYVGLYQVNALVPAGITAGAAVPVTISIGGVTSNTVTLPVQ